LDKITLLACDDNTVAACCAAEVPLEHANDVMAAIVAHTRAPPTRVHVLTSRAHDLYIAGAADNGASRVRILTTLDTKPHMFARIARPNVIGGLAAAAMCYSTKHAIDSLLAVTYFDTIDHDEFVRSTLAFCVLAPVFTWIQQPAVIKAELAKSFVQNMQYYG